MSEGEGGDGVVGGREGGRGIDASGGEARGGGEDDDNDGMGDGMVHYGLCIVYYALMG